MGLDKTHRPSRLAKEEAKRLHDLYGKSFALACVDEVIKANSTSMLFGKNMVFYWLQVKEELQKL